VRKLPCFSLLEGHDVKVFNNTVKGVGQLAARLSDVEALVLIRERTRVTRQLLEKLPKLRIISQTAGPVVMWISKPAPTVASWCWKAWDRPWHPPNSRGR
jgi:phosphoglycerate dehydrogenase-like enzyme